MKKILFLLMLLLPLGLMSQVKYDELVREMQSQSINVAFYKYQQFQKQSPEVGNVYFQMGQISYDYLKAVNPIIDYNSFKYYAYNSKLYFESALHFADDAEIRKHKEFYQSIAPSAKKLNYEDLKQYIDVRLDTIAYLNASGTKLYEAYSCLAKDYEECVSIFFSFNEKFLNINEALLLVENSDIENLNALKKVADRLNGDIDNYLSALEKYKIRGYNPQFVFYNIDLYRVDGLCSVNMLTDKVILYDYSKWVDLFLNKYERVNQLRNEAISVYDNLLNKKQVLGPLTLVNGLYLFDAKSYPAMMISLLGMYNQSMEIEKEIFTITDFDQKMVLAYKLSDIVDKSKSTLQNLKNIEDDDYLKYKEFNVRYLKEEKPYDLLKSKIDSIGVVYNRVLMSLKTEVDSLNQTLSHVEADATNNIDYLMLLKEPAATILYAYRYRQNSSFVLYLLDEKLYIRKVVF